MAPFSQFGDEWRREPDVKRLGPAGRDFFTCALQWCNEHRTDGLIPDDAIRDIAPGQRYPMKIVQILVDRKFFERIVGGYRIPPARYRRHNLFTEDLVRRGYSGGQTVEKSVGKSTSAPPLDAGSRSRSQLNARSVLARSHANPAPADTSSAFPQQNRASATPSSSLELQGTGERAREDAETPVDRLLVIAAAYSASGQLDKAEQKFREALALDEATRKPLDRAGGHAEGPGGGQERRSDAIAKEETA